MLSSILLFLFNFGLVEITTVLSFVISIFYLRSLKNLLKEIRLENRAMKPNHVWYILIPYVGLVWQFFVISKISKSLNNEFKQRNITIYDKKPSYNLGLTYSIIICFPFIPGLFSFNEDLGILISIIGLICWILYWVNIDGYLLKLRSNS